MKKFSILLLAVGLFCIPGCRKAPDYVTVQHVLIAFKGTLEKPGIVRTREEAASLARRILERARQGEPFSDLVKNFSDDAFPGIYEMANFDVPVSLDSPAFSRIRMAKAFGDVSFNLEPGEIGMAEYDSVDCPYGWHVIKRLK